MKTSRPATSSALPKRSLRLLVSGMFLAAFLQGCPADKQKPALVPGELTCYNKNNLNHAPVGACCYQSNPLDYGEVKLNSNNQKFCDLNAV